MSSSEKLNLDKSKVSFKEIKKLITEVKNLTNLNISKVILVNGENKISSTTGKIELTFSKYASWSLIAKTLINISEIDNNAEHEISMELKYDKIEKYEKEGYVVVSYGKIEGDYYKVIFEIPFSSPSALKKMALSIYNSDQEIKKDILWDGGDKRLIKLCKELKNLNWKVSTIKFVNGKNLELNLSNQGKTAKETKEKIIKKTKEN
ncbi:MAG: hypothetical protein BTN85_1489 [Candidatus Methanohalarchaeum thermophilum]|uniref:Uncharacterized protein n=1 Tax=Methanohalarchaeum thermophilum TaxID=1903181 RepID=A0A1Q6DX99_METT1|nr:MAG: hypothetical protein BTN85_1489 [Candidatus Methanohalarchaeum thermophilum]